MNRSAQNPPAPQQAAPQQGGPASFARPDHPSLSVPGEPGIRIVAPRTIALDAPFPIAGCFAITEPEHFARAQTPHRDLVLSVHREPFYACVHPFRDRMVFADDVLAAGPLRVGWFSFDVWRYCAFRREGRYFVRISLGERISQAAEVAVG